MPASVTHSSLGPKDVRPIRMTAEDCAHFADLARVGVNISPRAAREMMQSVAFDSIQGLITTASINTPVQFLQNWLPGFVETITAARKIDDLVGISVIGNWSDEEVVQGVLEQTGTAVPYGDYTNVPLASWNVNFETRTVVRFEEGLKIGRLEEDRAARMRVSSASEKRSGSAKVLEIQRNGIGFYGYNAGANRTFGFLNDPSLPAYIPVADTGGSDNNSTLWADKTFLEITADLRTAIVQLRTQSKDTIDPEKVPLILAIATDCVDYLSVTSEFGNSVRDWLTKTYPKISVVSAPELNNANSGSNVFYLYAVSVDDGSTDDSRIWIQVVPTKFNVVGVAQTTKGYEEDYSNATAGLMLKRPYAIVRFTDI